MEIKGTYIGDGVYANFDGIHIVLAVERHNRQETVYLDAAHVLPRLFEYMEKILDVNIHVTDGEKK